MEQGGIFLIFYKRDWKDASVIYGDMTLHSDCTKQWSHLLSLCFYLN
jgi:hypothetical protein